MAFTPAQDEWQVATGTNPANGPAVTPGNLALVRAVHRSGSGSPATISDNGGNVWHPVGEVVGGQYVGVVAGGSGDLYMWWCVPTAPFTAVDVQVGAGGVTRYVFMAEWTGNATEDVLLDAAWLANPSMVGALPAALVTTDVDGALVAGALGATVSNRTFTLLTAGYTAGREHRASQTTLISASRPDAPPGEQGPQWQLGGTSSTTAVITAAFRPAGSTPPPGPAEGAAAGTVDWTGTVSAQVDHGGAATEAHSWTGNTTASTTHRGTATAQHTWQGTVGGAHQPKGAVTGGHAWTGAAAGNAPAVDSRTGATAGSHTWTGNAHGARVSSGSAQTGHAWAGAAAGVAPSLDAHSGQAAGAHQWAGAAEGRSVRRGELTGEHSWAGRVAGRQQAGRNITITVTAAVAAQLAVKPPVHPLAALGPVRVLGRTVTQATGSAIVVLPPCPAPVGVTPPVRVPIAATAPSRGLLAVTEPRS